MYNEELKTKFIKGYTKSDKTEEVCAVIFNAFEKYELEWESDLCTKSKKDLQPIVDELVGFRVRSKWMRLIILKDYVNWCIGLGVPDACDGMLNITTIGLEKLKRQTVVNPLHLQGYLNSICEPESEQTTDNIYRCFYWLAYSGVDEEDILSIKCSDVDFPNMVINYRKGIPLYRESLAAFKNCVELTCFAYKHPSYNKIAYLERASGDTVVRGIKSAISLKAMRATLSRKSNKLNKAILTETDKANKRHNDNGENPSDKSKTDLKLSFYRVWISGLFYRMYESEKAGIPVDFSDAAAQFMEGKTYDLKSSKNKPEAKKRQIARDYMDDYQRWKLAYNL